MKLEDILYDKETSPARVKRELEKIYDRVEIEYRDPPEPLFQFNLECYDENNTMVKVIRYGYSNNCNRWFFEDVTPGEDVVYTDFEVWCGICGSEICHTTSYRKGTDSHFEVYCPFCLAERDTLLDGIKSLQSELREK